MKARVVRTRKGWLMRETRTRQLAQIRMWEKDEQEHYQFGPNSDKIVHEWNHTMASSNWLIAPSLVFLRTPSFQNQALLSFTSSLPGPFCSPVPHLSLPSVVRRTVAAPPPRSQCSSIGPSSPTPACLWNIIVIELLNLPYSRINDQINWLQRTSATRKKKWNYHNRQLST